MTPAAGKRLIAMALARHPQVVRAMERGTLLIVAGTTDGYVAEEALRALGFAQVRVRLQGDGAFTARIEVPADDIERLCAASVRNLVVAACKDAGFSYVSVDLQGYRTGSMNETL